MNLRKHGRVLYISSADISIGNGPGVNEREFILALYQSVNERAHFLVPRPERNFFDLPAECYSFSRGHRRHHPLLYILHIFSQIRLADKLLKNRQTDLLVFRLDIIPIIPLYITKKYNIPYAIKTLGEGQINSLRERGGTVGSLLTPLNLCLTRTLVTRSIVTDCVSLIQKEFLDNVLKVHPDKILWVDNAVNVNRFKPIPRKLARKQLNIMRFEPIVGYVGELASERGARQMIESGAKLINKYPNLGLMIVGKDPHLNDLKVLATEHNMLNHCIFTGYIHFEKVPLVVNALDIGVSINIRTDRKAAAELKVRQYIACGKPVVFSHGSNNFLADEKLGSKVEPTNLNQITAELDKWLSLTEEERIEFSHRASLYAQTHLSIQDALEKRFTLWQERYGVTSYSG